MEFLSQKKIIIIAIVVITVIVSGVITVSSNNDNISQPSPAQQSDLAGEVLIGSILPLTGDMSTIGEETFLATKLAVDDFNKHLEENGEPWHLKLVPEDSATNPVMTLEKLTSLNAKGIGVVIGPATSANIHNIKGYVDSNNMLILSCCSTAPALAIPGDNVFRLVTDDHNQANVLAKLAQKQEIGVLVPVYRGDTWGDGLVLATKEHFTKLGGIVDDGIRYNPESPEFSASASLLADRVDELVKQHGSDKVAVLLVSFTEGLHLMQSASSYDILSSVRWFGSDGNAKDENIVKDPIGREFTDSVGFTSIVVSAVDNPINEHVKTELVKLIGRTPITYTYSSYDAVWIAGLAMLDTKSTDVNTIKEAIPRITDTYSGALGSTKLNPAGDLAEADYEVWKTSDGKWMITSSYASSTDTINDISN